MKKNTLLILLILAFLATAFFGIRLASDIIGLMQKLSSSGGIIGGADLPTLLFMLESIDSSTMGSLIAAAVFFAFPSGEGNKKSRPCGTALHFTLPFLPWERA